LGKRAEELTIFRNLSGLLQRSEHFQIPRKKDFRREWFGILEIPTSFSLLKIAFSYRETFIAGTAAAGVCPINHAIPCQFEGQ